MVNVGALGLERILIEGKVFKGGATWSILERFLEKKKEKIIEDFSMAANPAELECLVEQIEANEYYEENVRIIDPEYFKDPKNIDSLFSLNAKLCSVQEDEMTDTAKELMALKYLLLFSREYGLMIKPSNEKKSIGKKEEELLAAYEYFMSRNKKVILLTPNKNLLKKAEEKGIVASTLENALYIN